METSPAFSVLPEQKRWEDVAVVTDTELTEQATRYCAMQLNAGELAQMSDGQRRAYLLDSMFGRGGWNMMEAPQEQYPEYPQSVGMYNVRQPTSWRIQQRVKPEEL